MIHPIRSVFHTEHRPERRKICRQFVGLGTGLALGSTVTGVRADAFVEGEYPPSADRQLRILNAHTGEKIDTVYYRRGKYIDDGLAAINHLMRDHRADEETAMDRALIDQLFEIQRQSTAGDYMHVLSGYRTPATNAALRKRSSNVAKYSLHMEGRAADIHIPGFSTRKLQAIAKDLKAGGVGYYGRSGFVHVDTGKIRHWER